MFIRCLQILSNLSIQNSGLCILDYRDIVFPHFDNCIVALDGTHIPVVVPSSRLLQLTLRHEYSTQNVLAICDFDMKFIFAIAGWLGSIHDIRVFNDAIQKYGYKFLHPPPGTISCQHALTLIEFITRFEVYYLFCNMF